MKLRQLYIYVFFLSSFALSENYWQQHVEYDMDVRLDTSKKALFGSSQIVYQNNSPDTLYNFYLNLYGNAFQKGTVKYREYLQNLGRSYRGVKFREIEKYESYYDINAFSIERTGSVISDTFKVDDTILSAKLATGLAPDQSMVISLEWVHYIGNFLERAGRVGKQYNFAQWYPRVVVYDENGWFDEPFHAEGEFYGEFGTYKVKMDVPKGYIIGSTGTLTEGDPGWKEVEVDTSKNFSDWLQNFKDNRIKYSTNDRRVVSFYAENVHDFAWVTSPDFLYEYGSWDGIDVHVLYNQKNGKSWTKKVRARTERSLEWLSKKFGPYPYPQVTNTDRIASGGMEYPMLVMDGSASEGLIFHEVGHIWFYGILANNEVREAWLDEGFTSFQTTWYMMDRYGPQGFDLENNTSYKDWQKRYWKFDNSLGRRQWGILRFQATGEDEPIARSTYMFKGNRSAGANAYTKPALMLHELKHVLGEKLFLDAMQEYYRRWALKHVNEKRLIDTVEEVTGYDLDWFFRSWLHDTRTLDYGISNWKKNKSKDGLWNITMQINRIGNRDMPQLIRTELKNGDYHDIWWDNHKFRVMDSFEYTVPSEPAFSFLDPEVKTMDLDFRNNYSGRMPSEHIFYSPGMNYNPRNRYVQEWLPTLHYSPSGNYLAGLRHKAHYSFVQELITTINIGSNDKAVWSMSGWQRNLHHGLDRSLFKMYDFDLIRGLELSLERSGEGYLENFTIVNEIKYMQVTDTIRSDLFEKGGTLLLGNKIFNDNFELALDVSPSGISDWSFSRLTFTFKSENTLFSNKALKHRSLFTAGKIWSSEKKLPVQELYTLSGASSKDTYFVSYLRNPNSLLGEEGIRGNFHLPGDLNVRGFAGTSYAGADAGLSFTDELSLNRKIGPLNLEFAAFLDFASVSTRYLNMDNTEKITDLYSYGIGLRFSSSLYGQPLYLRIDKVVDAKINEEKPIGAADWVFSFQKIIK